MNVSELALVQGMDDARAALRRWQGAPAAIVLPWVLGALAIAIALLAAVWIVAHLVTSDPSGYLAATAVTTAIAVPLLILAASLEVFVWPSLLRLASPLG